MKLETEEHGGECGHCYTPVNVKATVCAGCGAEWGLKNGSSRQELYDESIKAYRFCQILFGLCSIWLVLVFYYDADWAFRIFPILLFFPCFSAVINGRAKIKEAKSGKVSWWRVTKK